MKRLCILVFAAAASPVLAAAPVFPAKLGLDNRWGQFANQPLSAERVREFLGDDPQGGQLVRWGEARYTSLWRAVLRRLADEKQLITAIGADGEAEAQALLENAESLDDVVALGRRFPWSESVLRALLRSGERELRAGHAGLAVRCFHDVLERSGDPELRGEAQVGLLLALAHNEQLSEIAVPAELSLVLLGKKLPASKLLERLTQGDRTLAAAKLKDLQRVTLEAPRSPTWRSEQPASAASGSVVAGPNLISCFLGNEQKPAWQHVFPTAASDSLWSAIVPGPFRPAIAEGRVFTRWGVESISNFGILSHVAAFDMATGTQLWSTASQSDWSGLRPLNDPAYADGRVYVLAAARTEEYSPLQVVCLDAATGAALWKRELVSNHSTLASVRPNVVPGRPPVRVDGVDVATFGNAVTVHAGAVYVLTNAGVVGCCDSRDGAIEWVRSYPQDISKTAKRRSGAAPVVVGNQVVFLPRDAFSVFAVNVDSGELAWFSGNENATNLVAGVRVGKAPGQSRIIFADARRVWAVEASTGTQVWERSLPAPLVGQPVMVGDTVYAGTSAKLYRINTGDGEIAEEQDWGVAGAPSGFSIQGTTLAGSVVDPSSKLPAAAEAVPLLERPVHIVYRLKDAAKVDGERTEWPQAVATSWTGTRVNGAGIIGHDEEYLYLGLAGTDAAVPIRFDVTVTTTVKQQRWAVVVAQGKAEWQSLGSPVPGAAMAAFRQDLRAQTWTLELGLPLAALFGARKQTDWGRGNVEIALRDAYPTPFGQLGERFYIHHLLPEQGQAVVALASTLPELPSSWETLEQHWRATAANNAKLSDLYKNFIQQNSGSPAVGRALARLDTLLRRGPNDDPSSEILQFAEQVGVPESARTWYKKMSGAYLSQWLYIDPAAKPAAVVLEVSNGEDWERAVWGESPVAPPQLALPMPKLPNVPPILGLGGLMTRSIRIVTINGVRHIYINGKLVSPPPGAVAPQAGVSTLPPSGVWHEVRVPLSKLGLHDGPPHGIAFAQKGGGNIFWGRTALVIDGKETPLALEPGAEMHRQGDWLWMKDPERKGEEVHTAPPPETRDQIVRHSAWLKSALAQADGIAEERLNAAAAHLPSAPFDDLAAATYDRVIARLNGVPRRTLQTSILRQAAKTELEDWLEKMLVSEYQAGTAKPAEAIEAVIADARLPNDVAESFRQRSRREFVRHWQVIGPLVPSVRTYAAESHGVNTLKEHAGIDGKVRWQAIKSESEVLNLDRFLASEKNEKSAAVYAACWIHSEAKQRVQIGVGYRGGIKVWLNAPEQGKPVLDGFSKDPAYPGESVPQADLQAGWNQLLVRIDRTWIDRNDLLVDLAAPNGGRLVGVTVHGSPPQ